MKKVFAIIVLCCCALSMDAQVFLSNSIKYYDKFDDEIKIESRKTLVYKTDSTFIFEEKGKEPKVFYILNKSFAASVGDKDNIVNLVNNVYGYQNAWCVIKNEDKDKYFKEKKEVFKSGTYNYDGLAKYWLFVVNRVISRSQFSFYFENEFYWIENDTPEDNKLGNNINRIIYYNK